MCDTFTRFGGVGGVLVLLELLLFSLDRLGWWNGVQTLNISHAAGGPRGPWTWETLNSQPILYPQNICWTRANSGYQTRFADFTVYSPGSEEQCPNHSHRGDLTFEPIRGAKRWSKRQTPAPILPHGPAIWSTPTPACVLLAWNKPRVCFVFLHPWRYVGKIATS